MRRTTSSTKSDAEQAARDELKQAIAETRRRPHQRLKADIDAEAG